LKTGERPGSFLTRRVIDEGLSAASGARLGYSPPVRGGHFLVALASTLLASAAASSCGSRTGLLVDTRVDASLAIEGGGDAADAAADAAADLDVACTPRSCADQGFDCGENGDGCGGILQCGSCTSPQSCGLGGFSRCGGPDAAPVCVPQTCATLGFECGPAADGCGGLVQCGTCQAPLVCGAEGNPGQCGSTCSGLCAKQVQCDSGTTSVSGKVVAGTLPLFGAPDPINNAYVYIPNGHVRPFSAGVSCSQCGGEVSGNPLVATQTAPDGTFKLQNVPVGVDVPIVIQLGRWRRQITIPPVAPCENTALTPEQTRLPRNHTEGDIPLTAIATGYADGVECVLIKMGVDVNEFTPPSGGGRIQMYLSNGADDGPGTPLAETLWGDPTQLARYDQILLPCEGQQIDKAPSDQQNVIDYTTAGGRVFTTHYGYTWLYNDAFATTAQFTVSTSGAGVTQTGFVDTSSAKGKELATWLGVVGALSGPDQVSLVNTRYDVASVNPPSEQYLYATTPRPLTLQYGFYTPLGTPAAQQCGRVIFSDFHVVDQTTSTLVTFPSECAMRPMTSQEKALEFMLFDLASCVPGPVGPCSPLSCQDQGIRCGPAGDGCGNVIQCGSCTAPATCGGGGFGQCGPNVGPCVPETCSELEHDCGVQGDGCGGTIDCGTCSPPAICGGGGQPSVCGT
jgi:hypothetical protein